MEPDVFTVSTLGLEFGGNGRRILAFAIDVVSVFWFQSSNGSDIMFDVYSEGGATANDFTTKQRAVLVRRETLSARVWPGLTFKLLLHHRDQYLSVATRAIVKGGRTQENITSSYRRPQVVLISSLCRSCSLQVPSTCPFSSLPPQQYPLSSGL